MKVEHILAVDTLPLYNVLNFRQGINRQDLPEFAEAMAPYFVLRQRELLETLESARQILSLIHI